MRIDLPSGEWVDLVDDVGDISEKRRRTVLLCAGRLSSRAQRVLEAADTIHEAASGIEADDGISEQDLATILEMQDLAAVALITKWSFGDVINTSLLTDLSMKDYAAISAQVVPRAGELFGTDFGPSIDPERSTPTTP